MGLVEVIVVAAIGAIFLVGDTAGIEAEVVRDFGGEPFRSSIALADLRAGELMSRGASLRSLRRFGDGRAGEANDGEGERYAPYLSPPSDEIRDGEMISNWQRWGEVAQVSTCHPVICMCVQGWQHAHGLGLL